MIQNRVWLALAVGFLSVSPAYMAGAYLRDLNRARQSVAGRSDVVQTGFGALEYAVAGKGPPLLMIHGTGGGFDQGLAFAAGLIDRGHRAIAPSRFGYLRSDFPNHPSAERQADAFVQLLDALGIDKVPVAGGSAGALSAVQFALRHPDRCSALILLVPAANVRNRDPVQMSPGQQFMVKRLLTSDLLFWAVLKTMPETLIGTLLATDPQLLLTASPDERQRAYRILENLMPVSARWRGMHNDGQLAGNPAGVNFHRVSVPTLVISVEDDRFGTAATARAIAAAVPGAELIMFKEGGHIWIGHDEQVADAITNFLSRLPKSSEQLE
jgi:2-hydroxy-6-oxonona-2,4-dienedioate hydrolase